MVFMRTKKHMSSAVLIVAAFIAVTLAACSQFEPRDKRFYYRALWNFALREDLAELDSEFNGVDFGHSNLYEHLLLTGGTDVPAIEDRARKDTLAFIATKPRLNPNEEAIAPTYMKLAWRAQNTFDEAHALHRATYDIVVSDVGAHKVWVARLYQAYEPNTVIISNGFAAMGISLPGAIAAKLVHPDRKVVALCGDGGP